MVKDKISKIRSRSFTIKLEGVRMSEGLKLMSQALKRGHAKNQ